MEYGELYGELYGGPVSEIETHAADALAQYPSCFDSATMLRALTEVLADRWQGVENGIRSVYPYALLDYDRVHGVWLDLIGSILNLPRTGRTDDEYRVILAAYAQLVYPRRRTTEGLLAALQALHPDATISYLPVYPKSFRVTIAPLSPTGNLARDTAQIVDLATPVTYRGGLIAAPDPAFGFGDSSGVLATPAHIEGFGDSSGTISGGGGWAAVI